MSDKPDPKETGLIPTRNNSLTTRSSSLVRRGLEDLISQQARIVRFPPNRSMGTLYLWHKDVTWAEALDLKKGQCVDARGMIAVPVENKVKLQVSEEAASDLSPLAALEAEDLQDLSLGSQVDDAGLLNIRGLIGLKGLFLEGTRISDDGLPHLRRLTNLESLAFWGTRITDAGLVDLRELTELQFLGLFYTQINGAGLIHLSGLMKLKRLFFWGAQITDAGLENIRGLSSLKELNLTAPRVTDAGLAHIKELTALEWLNLQSAQITDAYVDDLRRALPKCRIHVEGNPKV